MSLGPGSTIGPFKIQSLLGKGGMGEVFSALDTRLNRSVALKLLPPEFATDSDRLRRFQLEARTLATLNHPNVALLFGFEEHASRNVLVLELVEGETLADRLQRGRLPLDETLQIAIQIASALEAAHEKGVIHRDLKPANIKVTPEDRAKVLDFGLAKLAAPEPSSSATLLADSPTILTGSTLPGVILGTAGYMSPEQAKGKSVDKRTDIWSFGCVLYECLAGKQPFPAESVSESIGAILHHEPEWSALPPNTPVQLQHLLHRCLAKDRNKRLHDIADARLELESVLSGPVENIVTSPIPHPRRTAATLVATALFGILLGALSAFVMQRKAADTTQPPAAARKLLVRLPGIGRDDGGFVISPNGGYLAFISNDRLFIRNLAEFDSSARAIPNTEGAILPFWSPDGEWVGFAIGKKLYKVRASGSQPQAVAEASEGFARAGGGAWLADNSIVFGTGGLTNGLLRVSANGGPSHVFVPTDPATEIDFHDPVPLPDGKSILFVVHSASNGFPTIFNKIAVSSGGPRKIIYEHSPPGSLQDATYSPSGHIIFGVRSGPGMPSEIWAVPYSVEKASVTGDPKLLYQGAFPNVSAEGTLFFVAEEKRHLGLVKYDRQGRILSSLGTLHNHNPSSYPALSPDGKQAITSVFPPDVNDQELWVHEAGNSYQLTYTDRSAHLPTYSSDGSNVLFSLRPPGPKRVRLGALFEGVLAVIPSRGGEIKDVVSGASGIFSGDGRSIVYLWMEKFRAPPCEIRTVPFPPGTNEPLTLFKSSEIIGSYSLSPDGQIFAYESADRDYFCDIVLTRFPSFTGRWQINSPKRSYCPVWRQVRDQLYLYYTDSAGAIYELPVDLAGNGIVPGAPRKLFDRNIHGLRSRNLGRPPGFDLSADGQEFLSSALPEGAPQEMYLQVVENLAAELKTF